MAKFCGIVGFVLTVEKAPGVFIEVPSQKTYKGDVLKYSHRWESTEHLNDDILIDNQISIVANNFACKHLGAMRYVEWMGTRWEIKHAQIQKPRIILTIGGVYNGE